MARVGKDEEAEEDVAPTSEEAAAPVDIPAAVLAKLKVGQIKEALSARNVSFSSKLRKRELLELLKTSLHLPAIGKTAAMEMEPVEEKTLEWNQDHPARHLLYTELVEGRIPLDAEEMGPAEVYYLYSGTLEFQIKGMEYDNTFTRRLGDLRKQVKRDTGRAQDDKNALQKAINKHPVACLNHHGKPQWNGSVAQALLEYDMLHGKHTRMTPAELREERKEYKRALSVNDFRWKIRQNVRTEKYLYTLKYDADQKLRANLKKAGIVLP